MRTGILLYVPSGKNSAWRILDGQIFIEQVNGDVVLSSKDFEVSDT